MKKNPRPKNFVQANFSKMLFAAFLSLSFLSGCQKEVIKSSDKIAVNGSTDVIVPYSFDWDAADFMPTPPGYSIMVPWAYGATGSIASTYDADVYSDHKASDGWVLVASTFSPSRYYAMPYFILYNKYRGLLRIYQYNDNTGLNCSSNLESGINWAGNGNGSNKALNFLGTDIVDVSNTQTTYTALEPRPKDGNSNPVSPHKWYMLQYEIAYDPTIVPTTLATPPTLSWYLNFYDITKVNLGGTLDGTVSGTLGATTLQQNINKSLTNTAVDLGKVGLSALGVQFFNTNSLGLPTSIFSLVQKGVNGALSSSAGSLPGDIINIFSAILGGNSNGQALKLDLKANLTITGTNTNSGSLLPSTPIIMPGSLKADANGQYNNNITGWIPIYNNNLGVFNLSNKPTVNEVITITNPPKNPLCNFRCNYVIDNSSIQIQWNPAVTDIATISNLTAEVVASEPGWSFKNTSGRIESYSGSAVYTGKDNLTVNYSGHHDGNEYNEPVYVRISFKVVPKNGAPTSTIVKTFVANVNQTTVDKYNCPTCPNY